jgi:N utilization substance protein B
VKNKYDPRHIHRLKVMQALFAYDFGREDQIAPEIHDIVSHLPSIDAQIEQNAPKWPINKINKIDLAILRQAFWELSFNQATPYKVIIDEAVELAKEFGAESSSSFVNGVLGTAIKKLEITQTPATDKS